MDHGSGKSYRTAFTLLKEKLVKAPILQLPDLSRQFKVYTDASGHALGAIQSQTDSQGKEYVCHYESRLLKGSECCYEISEKECLGIVWAIRKFRHYLYDIHFQIVMDITLLSNGL